MSGPEESERPTSSPLPGLLLAAAGAATAFALHALAGGLPLLTAALLLGLIAGSIVPFRRRLDRIMRVGLAVSSRRLLRLGIVLLGLKLSLYQIAALGPLMILSIVGLVLLAFGITLAIARWCGLGGDESILLAAGFSICGVSAIGAMSAARGAEPAATARPVALVTLYGTLAILLLPALAPLFGLDSVHYGQWVGASVHDVGQVVATAQSAGAAALAVAVVVKLTRVLMLAPMVAVMALVSRRAGSATTARPAIMPLFIVGFAAMVLVRSFLPIPEVVLGAADIAQSFLLAMALFAVGSSIRLERLFESGLRALLAGLLSWVAILGLGLGLVSIA